MEFWNSIIHTALLGTGKKPVAATELGPALSAIATQIAQETVSKEEQFLKIASIAFNYRQAGITALKKESVTIAKAPAEEKNYCSTAASQVLKNIIDEESLSLLKYWLQVCALKQQLIPPELLPALLQTGVLQKQLQPYIINCGGQRAAWLGHFNMEWRFSSGTSKEDIWQTGTPEQRRQLIRQIRKEDTAKAREWIQQTWQQEDAATKTDLLKIMEAGINETDIPFLESLSAEKSKKVKDEALALLKKIPSSSIVQQYQQMLKQMVQIKKEKALLGMISRMSLQLIALPSSDEAIFKTGIDKLSNNKEFTDEEFIAFQLMQYTPLSFYEAAWQLKPEEIIDLFQKESVGKKLLPALVLAAVNFHDNRWANFMMQHCNIFNTDIIPLLPVQQQEYYSNKFFNDQPESIIQFAAKREQEWGIELARSIFKHASKNPYQYNRSFFNQHIHLIPAAIAAELEKFTPAEDGFRVMWSNTSDYILKLMSLKIQTIKAFNE